VRLEARAQAWCGVGLPQGTFTRAVSPAGLRPLGNAKSPRVFLKESSQKAQRLRR
jgi:hypothetical protein